jgi:pimeloyl-ACP methyl ester carboxylesterase
MINFTEKVKLGGFPQKIHFKGESIENPVLLVLHGGPGIPNRASLFKQHSDLCSKFTLVGWDQRGSGGSYVGIDKSTLTVDQMVSDAKELVEYLTKKLVKKKIFLLCGSWGTQLGTLLAHKYPEKIAGYVGSGQSVNGIENERISYEYALEKAKEANDIKSVDLLEEYGPPVNGQYKDGLKGLIVQRRIMKKYGGNSVKKGGWIKHLVIPILLSREYTILDKIGIIKGYSLVLSAMWPQLVDYDFNRQCTNFEMPYYIFQGRHDNNTPSALVEEFFSNIVAPDKDLVWFENAAHGPMNEEPEKYKEILIQKLIPIHEKSKNI